MPTVSLLFEAGASVVRVMMSGGLNQTQRTLNRIFRYVAPRNLPKVRSAHQASCWRVVLLAGNLTLGRVYSAERMFLPSDAAEYQ